MALLPFRIDPEAVAAGTRQAILIFVGPESRVALGMLKALAAHAAFVDVSRPRRAGGP